MATNVASVINNLIRWGGMVLLAYFMFRTVQSLAGQTTSANIGLRLFGEVRLSDVIASAIFGGGGAMYGLAQRRLRHTVIKEMSQRIKQLEAERDPTRSSSKLTARGETNPEDI